MRLKISLRETEHKPRERVPLIDGGARGCGVEKKGDGAGVLGKNEGTVRFLFGSNGASS